MTPTPPDEILALAQRFALSLTFPPAALAEAAALVAAPSITDPTLVDRTDLPFVTIDNDDSLDLDQALCLVDGPAPSETTVHYALADASHFAPVGSALFAEALARGSSFYLPEFTIPMLPRSLSEGITSLNPDSPRRAILFSVILDATGAPRSTTFSRARVLSRRKLSYRQVQAYWDGLPPDDPARPLADQPFSRSLDLLLTVGRRRVALAEARDVVHYPRIEVDIAFRDPHSRTLVAFEARRYEADRMNEQISLLVNVEGARLLASRLTTNQPIFRTHPAPEPSSLAAFATLVRDLLVARSAPSSLAWDHPAEPLATWLDRLDAAQRATPALAPLALALQRQALMLNRRSELSPTPAPHFGIGAPVYARLTAPMRELVGLFTHKEALEAFHLTPPSTAATDDEALRDAVIASANRAKDQQNALNKAANQLVIDALLRADLAAAPPPPRLGTLIGLGRDRLYVLLDAPPLELKVYVQDLFDDPKDSAHVPADQSFTSSSTSTTLTLSSPTAPPRTFTLGDRLALTTLRHDPARDRWAFAVTLAPPRSPSVAS